MTVDPAEVLRRHDLQVTAGRLAVLRAVVCRPHSTADVIAKAARDRIGMISRHGHVQPHEGNT